MSISRFLPRWLYHEKQLPDGRIKARFLCFKRTYRPVSRLSKIFKPLYAEYPEDFVAPAEDSFIRRQGDARLLAFYLPQFHAIPLNDKHFGKGFTEWTNVTKAKPQFLGHHQPQLPIDVGFYDLSHDDVMYRQVELARQYGVYGFCFHYYWFGKSRRLLEKPLFNWLNNKELNFPFCLCWANENWSTLWDGGERNIIMEQKMDEHTYADFVEDILPFLKDERYIRIGGEPLLVIYRPSLFSREQFVHFIDGVRREVVKHGIPGIRVLMSNAFQRKGDVPDCREWHTQGVVEFPPHGLYDLRPGKKPFLQENKMCLNDFAAYLQERRYMEQPAPQGGGLYKCCFPSWDNTARKTHSGGHIFMGCTPQLYRQWLTDCICYSNRHLAEDERYVFINAWNEWAEGAHLEPDQRYGYAYLRATREAVESMRNSTSEN